MVIDPTSMHVLFIQYPPRTQVFKHKIEVFCFVLFCFVALLLPDAMQGLRKSSENVLKKKKKRRRRRRRKKEKKNVELVLITNSMTLRNFLILAAVRIR